MATPTVKLINGFATVEYPDGQTFYVDLPEQQHYNLGPWNHRCEDEGCDEDYEYDMALMVIRQVQDGKFEA